MGAVKPGSVTAGRALGPALLVLAGLGLSAPAYAEIDCLATPRLEVRSEAGQPLVTVPMPEGAGWCLAWNHSVEGFEVLDCYRNVSGRMVLERSHLPDFAAGLDHVLGRGRQTSDGHGGYWIEDIDEVVPGNRYRLRVGAKRVDHRLVSRGDPALESLVRSARACTGAGFKALPQARTPISLSDLAANRAVSVELYVP